MSVSEKVEEWIEKRPYVQEALADEIVNYSALARKAGNEVEGSFEAIKMALRRQAQDLKDRRRKRRRNIGKVMEGTSIKLENNVRVCKSSVEPEGKIIARTESGYTAVQNSSTGCSGEAIPDQVLITLESPSSLEDTPGVLSYLLSLFAARDINITEAISCREDTHLVIDEEDASETFELLNEKLEN